MDYLVTGASGLLGSEILSLSGGICVSRSQYEKHKVIFQNDFNGKTLIHCAAKVGGIKANMDFIADFYDENMKLNMQVIEECRNRNIKLVSILSTCIYPDAQYVKYPLTENQLHAGPPHYSNFGYAYAKRMLDIQTRAYRRQHGCKFITVVPNNLYGINDNYALESSHVVPALIRKFCEAKMNNRKFVTVWGTGRPVREFTFARDAAKIILWLAENYDEEEPVNIGNTEQTSIRELAELISEICQFNGKIIFDETKPDGQMMKPSSNLKLKNLGYNGSYTPLYQGLSETISYFVQNYPNLRGIN